MTILMWDKPKKKMSTEEWKTDVGFDSGPTGGYSPNMSDADKLKWKAKITGTKSGFPQVEIRKSASNGTQMTIIVSLGNGFNYKYWAPDPKSHKDGLPTKGINIHLAMNGPSQMTFEDMDNFHAAIQEAKEALQNLKP